ncbi:hypothetical protein L6452_16931 [Arctium lappa]|uniref:Uncharacterized protein n=1 Tax=Arctium lappa TaxID=4217 RepID=A0ACB9C1W5_ARCLA|nr:hypothetical protein L6452_16931 [Arctium lappa]
MADDAINQSISTSSTFFLSIQFNSTHPPFPCTISVANHSSIQLITHPSSLSIIIFPFHPIPHPPTKHHRRN